MVRLSSIGLTGMRYSPSEFFNRDLDRALRFRYPTYMFSSAHLELDEDGTPWWVCPRESRTIGLFGGRDIIGAVLLNACTGEHAYYPVDEIPEALPVEDKIIPLFGTAAAAGPGEMDTGLPWEDYAVPADSPADFAIRISGDSMEPVLHDGQIALCAEKTPQIGDVAVMQVNGCMLVKQFIRDSFGNLYLRSVNRDRSATDVDVKASGNDTVLCFGTVLLPQRPALPLG